MRRLILAPVALLALAACCHTGDPCYRDSMIIQGGDPDHVPPPVCGPGETPKMANGKPTCRTVESPPAT